MNRNEEVEKKLEADYQKFMKIECDWINEVLWKIESNITFPRIGCEDGPERAAVITHLLNNEYLHSIFNATRKK